MGLGDISDATDEEEQSSTSDNSGKKNKAVRISKDEFQLFLKDDCPGWWHEVDDPNSGEIVYQMGGVRIQHPSLVMRVYTTVSKTSLVSRPKGDDAIRLVLYDTENEQLFSGRKKTLRIKTWKKNLLEKINDMLDDWKTSVEECPKCGSVMMLRDGEYGEFYGCTAYPDCDATLQAD